MGFFLRYILLAITCLLLLAGTVHAQPAAAKTHNEALMASIMAADKVLNTDSAIILYDTLLQQCINADYADGAFLAWIRKSIKYFEKEDYPMVRYCSMQALPWAEKGTVPDNVAWCYVNVSEAYINEANYAKALDNLYIAQREFYKRTKEPNHTTANIYINFASVYMQLNEPEKAMHNYDLAEDVSARGKLYFQLGSVYVEKAKYYLSVRQPLNATKYYNLAMGVGLQAGKADLQAMGEAGLGKVLAQTRQYDSAAIRLKNAISFCKGKYDYIATDAQFALIDVLGKQGKYAEAAAYALGIIQVSTSKRQEKNKIKAYTMLAAIYRAMGRTSDALYCMDTLLMLKDTLAATDAKKAVGTIEIKYNAAEKDKELAQNQLLIARQKSKIVQKNIWITGVCAGILILAMLSAVLYRNARTRQQLHEEVVRTLEKEKTIGVLKGMMEGADNERSRIARDLHDGIGGMLSAAMMRIRSIKHEHAAIATVAAYTEGMEMLGSMGDEIRKTAHNLMPDVLLKQPLAETLEGYCNAMQMDNGVAIVFHSFGMLDDLPQNIKLNVYRIVQELVKNVVQHAGATQALVQLVRQAHMLTITVEDNGKGFASGNGNGMGLNNLRTRVSSMNGVVEIDTAEGKGTSVFIELEIAPDT